VSPNAWFVNSPNNGASNPDIANVDITIRTCPLFFNYNHCNPIKWYDIYDMESKFMQNISKMETLVIFTE